ncbi:unnamed protein product [Nyctereutes procyonoides]|uniref:(raccoon dog) hypothetical protein n=1 Tax=Nyctereutes procyonoides TaxID=34880 RepID=A0A811YTV6_NYCPR|nr:unnamed protein product [Nyctereutes procyonoides]
MAHLQPCCFYQQSGKYGLTVPDPWDPHWAMGVTNQSTLKNQADTIRVQEHLQTNPTQDQDPFSWVKLIQQGTSLANLSSIGNLSHCFICAALGKTPLSPAPMTTAPHLSLTGVPLFTDPLNHQFPFCYSTPNSSLCNATWSNVTSHYTPISGFFWCNGTLSESLNTSASLLLIFLLLVFGVSLASTLVATGLGTRALIHSIDSSRDLSERLQMAIEASAKSLASLQHQITLVAQAALQNRWPLDLLTAEKGGTCMFLNKECYYYINETGVVETNLHTLAKTHESLQKPYHPVDPTTPQWWQTPLTTWLLPLLSALLIIGILLMVAPCFLQFIQ